MIVSNDVCPMVLEARDEYDDCFSVRWRLYDGVCTMALERWLEFDGVSMMACVQLHTSDGVRPLTCDQWRASINVRPMAWIQ